MSFRVKSLLLNTASSMFPLNLRRCYYGVPFFDLYQYTTGQTLSEYMLNKLKTKHPTLHSLSSDQLHFSLQILKKFSIDPLEACSNPHVFCMNPISLDNYGEILKECRFVHIGPKQLIRYHTLVRSRTIAHHKKEGLIRDDIELEEVLQNYFQEWPSSQKLKHKFEDSTTSILTVRLSVLERYLTWKLSITPDEFQKYCKNYLPLKHKPMSDIQDALNIAENDIKFDLQAIRRNGFIISADPINTQLILENVQYLAGMDIREAIRIEPAILKNNYNSLLKIRNILLEYRISQVAQQRCLKVFCMCPDTVRDRLDELSNQKEYNILSTNPRVLSMVVHKRKMMTRLSKIQAARKQCYSLNHLVSSSKVFNDILQGDIQNLEQSCNRSLYMGDYFIWCKSYGRDHITHQMTQDFYRVLEQYISSFGDKVCGRDIAVLIASSLNESNIGINPTSSERLKWVLKQLRRHKFWLHAALSVVDENIKFLQQRFRNKVIIDNCQLLLYPVSDIEQYIRLLLSARNGERSIDIKLDTVYNNLQCEKLTDDQILSLALYEIEKKYHFSGDGIWSHQDRVKIDCAASS